MAPYSQPHICYLTGQIFRLDVRIWGGGGMLSQSPEFLVCVQMKGMERASLSPHVLSGSLGVQTHHTSLAFSVFYLYACMSATP